MSAQVNVVVAGQPQARDLDGVTTWADVLAEVVPGLRGVVVARVDGALVDLDQPVREGSTVEPVLASDPDGLMVLRHSTAHVMAQAVQDVFPEAKLGIGPPIENGFYYEFDAPSRSPPRTSRASRSGWSRSSRRASGSSAGSSPRPRPWPSWPASRTSAELIGSRAGRGQR